MSSIRQTTTRPANPAIVPALIRWAGLSAVVAGVIFAGIQPVHPADVVASVTTPTWAIVTTLKTAMCFLFLAGIAGIYARQSKEAGWLGAAGFILLSLSWWLQTGFVFAETVIFPLLAGSNPQFVDSALAFIGGRPNDVTADLGALTGLYSLLGVFYVLGGLLFGLATYRANILPRWAAALLAGASILTPLAAMLPHQIQRFAAVPVGLAIAGLGVGLLMERRYRTAESVPAYINPQSSEVA